ncbi:MAG TPA: rhodanese-like domain-containing protein [Vicinamibacterales bacterium]|jgi:rhodanese-related sulfurtransferase
MKRQFFEGLTLVVLAVVCALTSNALASRERKMALVGYYPSATKVPKQTTTEPTPIAAVPTATITPPPTTTTVAPVVPQKIAAPKPKPEAPRPEAPPAVNVAQFKPHPDKAYVEIPYSDVAALHNAGVLFLDARRTSIYEQGHIAGARTFSVWESDIDDKVKKLYEERQDPAQQAQPIVVYCSGGECEDSHMLAQKLWGVLFNNVYVYKDGFPDWTAHKGDVHTGPNP